MKDADFGREDVCVVKDEQQARLLSDSKSFRYLEPFIARELSASQAAKEIGCKLDTLLYRIGTFLNAGLLKIVRREPRRGRPVKIYRSSADAYFMPYAALPYADFEEGLLKDASVRNAQLAPALARVLRSSGLDGRTIFRHDTDGTVWRNSAQHPDATKPNSLARALEQLLEGVDIGNDILDYEGPVGTDFFSELQLSKSEAKVFLKQLYNLWRNFNELSNENKTKKGCTPHYFSVSFVEKTKLES